MTLKHVALLSKGWYDKQSTGDIWKDFRIALEMDDYTLCSKNDIIHIVFPQVLAFRIKNEILLKEMILGFHPDLCWKRGYYHKGNALCSFSGKGTTEYKDVEYDYFTAILYACRSIIRDMDREECKGISGKDDVDRKLFVRTKKRLAKEKELK